MSFILSAGGVQPAELQEVSVPIWENRDCKLKYGIAAPGGIVDHFLCAGQPSRDSCSVSFQILFIEQSILSKPNIN